MASDYLLGADNARLMGLDGALLTADSMVGDFPVANVVLGFPDYVTGGAAVTFSGGSFPTLPLTNLLKSDFAYVARSASAATANTAFWIDLGVARASKVFAVPKCNGSLACQLRIRACTTQSTGTAIYDSGASNLWDGTVSAEDMALFPRPFYRVFPTPLTARYWYVEFLDASNPAGYIEFPRIVISPAWQPTLNMAYGATMGLEDTSVIQTSQGCAEFFSQRKKRRTAKFSLPYVPDAEMFVKAGDMAMRLGTSGQLFFIRDPGDAVNIGRHAFLARVRTLNDIEAVSYGRETATFDLIEIVA